MSFLNQFEYEDVKKLILESNENQIVKLFNIKLYIYNNFNVFVKYNTILNKMASYNKELKALNKELEDMKTQPYNFDLKDYSMIYRFYEDAKLQIALNKDKKNVDFKRLKDSSTYNDFEILNNEIKKRDKRIIEVVDEINIIKRILTNRDYKICYFLDVEINDYIKKYSDENGNIPRLIEKDKKLDEIINLIKSDPHI
jgi:hypothetical protein